MNWNLLNNTHVKELLILIPLGAFLAYSVIDYSQWVNKAPTICSYKYTDINNIGQRIPTGNISIEDLHNRLSKSNRYTLSIVTEAEDEYWEIEKIGDTYYRVRREDYEEIDGYYEFDTEEELGTLEDVYHYVRNNKVPKRYR